MWPMSLFLKLSPNMSKQFAKIEWCPETVVDLLRNASHSTLCRSLTLPSKVSLGPRQPLAHLLVDLAKQFGKHVTMVQRWLWEIGLQRWSKEFGCFEKHVYTNNNLQPSSLMAPRRRMKRKLWAPVASSFMAPDNWTGAFSSLSSIKHHETMRCRGDTGIKLLSKNHCFHGRTVVSASTWTTAVPSQDLRSNLSNRNWVFLGWLGLRWTS